MSEIPADIIKTARELAQNAINGMCMTMDHSFGLQSESEQRGLKLSMSQIAEHDVAPAIAKAIMADRERNQWQDISTAPKDGTRVLCICVKTEGLDDFFGYSAVDSWNAKYQGFGMFNTKHWPATHWMPIPAAPVKP